jgi:hypothetical protein
MLLLVGTFTFFVGIVLLPRGIVFLEVWRRAVPVIAVATMVKVAGKAPREKAPPRQRRKLVRIYTAWHPLLVVLLERVLPGGWYQCLSEFQLSREPLRIDVVVVRRSRPGTPPAPRLLASVVGDLADHTLVHFKGPTDELERDDAWMLLAYALHYVVVAEIEDPAHIALRVVAPRLTPRFVEALRSLGCELTTTAAGTHEGRLGVFPLRVIETVPVNGRAGEHLLYAVTPGMVADPGGGPALDAEEMEVYWALREHVEQLRHPPPGLKRRHMKDENKVVESFDQALASLVARLPPEQRLAGLTPEQRLAGLAPEQRLAGLTEAQAVLALPDATLRALPSEYLATLPQETREAIQRRVGGKASSPRKPTRRRKTR